MVMISVDLETSSKGLLCFLDIQLAFDWRISKKYAD